jgi:hypothetical protein
MTTLAELQAAFGRALDGDAAGAEAWVVGGTFSADERLAVYRHNGDALLHQMLQAAYPAVERLAGADYLRGIVADYRRTFPSRSGNLHDAAASLPDYLARELDGTPQAFLADLARLEWAYQEVLVAADPPLFDVAAFSALTADDHDRLVFELAPSVRVVRSPWPIGALWEAYREEGPGADIDLDSGGERLLLHRVGREARIRPIDQANDVLIAALERGEPLPALVTLMEAQGVADEPTTLLYPLIRDRLIAGFHLT